MLGRRRLIGATLAKRPSLNLARAESRWRDREHGDRPVLCRQRVARAPTSHPLVTFDS
jgi:hypothetical protein